MPGVPPGVPGEPLQLFEALADHITDGCLVIGPDRRLRFANPRAVELLGLPEGWLGCSLATVSADYRLALTVTSCFDHGRPIVRSLAEASRGRETVVRALPISAGNVVEEVLVVIHDETELRRLETVRRDFTANISHELRTPATAIKLMVDTLQSGALEDHAATVEFVARIGQEARHMTTMVEELLELSALESPAGMAPPEPVTVATLLATLDRLRPLADDRGVTVEIEVEPGIPPLSGRPQRLEQVVRNLVHNAIKFSPAGSRVEVRAVSRAERWIEIRVTDQGPGIPVGDLPRIFERFWKGDSSRRRDGEGSGLGLAIGRHIAEAHGGTLVAHSIPPRGTTLVLSLPSG